MVPRPRAPDLSSFQCRRWCLCITLFIPLSSLEVDRLRPHVSWTMPRVDLVRLLLESN